MARLDDLNWERLAIRMLHKVCPNKDKHAEVTATCSDCGITRSDFDRFIIGSEGKLQ